MCGISYGAAAALRRTVQWQPAVATNWEERGESVPAQTAGKNTWISREGGK